MTDRKKDIEKLLDEALAAAREEGRLAGLREAAEYLETEARFHNAACLRARADDLEAEARRAGTNSSAG